MAVSANSTTPEQFVVAQNLEMQADNDKNMRKTSLSAPDLPHTTAAEENVEVTAHLSKPILLKRGLKTKSMGLSKVRPIVLD